VNIDKFCTLALDNHGLQGHSQKLLKPRCRTTVRKTFFTNRVINDWNSLPQEVMFKNRLIRLGEIWASTAEKLPRPSTTSTASRPTSTSTRGHGVFMGSETSRWLIRPREHIRPIVPINCQIAQIVSVGRLLHRREVNMFLPSHIINFISQ